MKLNRRQLLISGALGALALSAYSYHRGVRLPTLHWDPSLPERFIKIKDGLTAKLEDCIKVTTWNNANSSFRAFAPEPSIELASVQQQTVEITVNNIIDDAVIHYSGSREPIIEHKEGITRRLTINLEASSSVRLSWKLKNISEYQFATIGDTGGNHELKWCLQRAHDLNARFLLHLGDFNYQAGDYQRSIELFRDSPLPVYVAIGNHDFHENGAIYDHFLNEIGPLNNAFAIDKTRFINIDTAANTLPFSAGHRGDLFKQLALNNGEFKDTVAFTHRPLHDPTGDTTHDIGSLGERDWLIASLKSINAKTLLSGHIHIYDRRDFDGIDNIIAGQGLGHQDLIVGRDYSFLSIGNVSSDGQVHYSKAALAMPMEMHCHPRIQPVKDSLLDSQQHTLIERVNKACAIQTKT